MNKNVLRFGLYALGAAVFMFFIVITHEMDLRTHGLIGRVDHVYHFVDQKKPVEISLVFLKSASGPLSWTGGESRTVKMDPSPEVNWLVEKGQWVRVVKNGGGLWHLGKLPPDKS
jgi:hypothetical protein